MELALKNKKNKFLAIFFLSIIFILFFSSSAQAGIIPCGRSVDDPETAQIENVPCTLCHFIIGIKKIIDFGSEILLIIAITAIFISGIMYTISAGSTEMMTRAKSFLASSLIGFSIVLTAWFIVNSVYWVLSIQSNLGIGKTNWYTFTCVTQSTTGTAPVPTITPQTYPENILNDSDARAKLKAAGISVTSTGNCNIQSRSDCTSLEGIPAATVKNIIDTKDVCGITPIVTGGTEVGHQSHGSGKPVVDFSWNDSLASCLKNKASALNVHAICTTSQDSQYRINCSYNEPTRHIHVQY